MCDRADVGLKQFDCKEIECICRKYCNEDKDCPVEMPICMAMSITGSQIGYCFEKITEEKEVILTTDKTEYQTDEDVKITIKNNLEESVFLAKSSCHGDLFPHPILQKYEAGAWTDYEWYPYHPFSHKCILDFLVCDEIQSTKEIELLLQGEDLGVSSLLGKYRIGFVFGKSCNSQESIADHDYGLIDEFIIYSNKFTIKNDSTKVNDGKYCIVDNDCKAYFSDCDCQHHCINKNIKIKDCAPACEITVTTTIPECICENNKCVD
ncbi:MAG: hypothetical protein KAQ92_02420, partial [Candidatus Aenigmarchaeota archaeon]|nr:hypothetical protein [Candidatus Aenigmarchaeota archaeon]